MARARISVSAVSAEFRSYRNSSHHYLDRPNVTGKVQQEVIITGTETLHRLDASTRPFDVLIHLVGDMTGAMAQALSER